MFDAVFTRRVKPGKEREFEVTRSSWKRIRSPRGTMDRSGRGANPFED